MEPGVEARVREAVAALEAAGATVEEVSLPHTDYGLATYYIVAPAEASANLARYDGIRFGPRARRRRRPGQLPRDPRPGLRGRGQAPDHARDVRPVGRLLRRLLPEGAEGPDAHQGATSTRCWAQGFDALVAPTSPTVAFRFGDRLADPVSMYLSDACTLPVNMAGLPGVSIPCGLSEGLPVGLQLIGARLVGGVAVRAGARLRGDHRGRRLARRSSRPSSAAAADPAARRRRERMAALAGSRSVD